MSAVESEILSILCENVHKEIDFLSNQHVIYPLEFMTFITSYNLSNVYNLYCAKLKEKWVEEKFIKCLSKLAVPEDSLSIWTGLGSVVYTLEVVGDKWGRMYVDEMKKQLLKKIKDYIFTLDFFNLDLSQIDFTHGISGILFLASEIKYMLSKNIGIDLLNRIYNVIEKEGLERIYVENENMLCGFSHGEIGIYLSCLLYANSIGNIKWKNYYGTKLVEELECRFDGLKSKNINQLTNTWCHGYIGFCRAYRIAKLKGLIYSELLETSIPEYLNSLKTLNLQNIGFSSVLCHGWAGIVHEINQTSYNFSRENTLKYFKTVLLELVDDKSVYLFSDHEESIKQHGGKVCTDIMMGYQGVLLTLCSIEFKKIFKGSILLGG